MARDPNDPNADENDLPLQNKLMAPLPDGYQRPITLLINLNVMIKQYHTVTKSDNFFCLKKKYFFIDLKFQLGSIWYFSEYKTWNSLFS